MKINSALLCLSALMSAPALAQEGKLLPRSLANLSPDDFASRVLVHDHASGDTVVLSTQRAHKGGQSLSGAFADDVHLRALMDRRSGAVTWQVWHSLTSYARDARVDHIAYRASQGSEKIAPSSLDHWEDTCSPGDASMICGFYMRVVFELPEAVVQEIAGSYVPNSRQPWPVRFSDETGKHIVGGLAPAEAAGLLKAVRARQGSTTLSVR